MIPYIPEKFNSRRIEYLREYEGGYRNIAREARLFSEVTAEDFLTTVFIALTTVFVAVSCRVHSV